MPDTTVQELAERQTAFQRQNRRLRRAVAVLLTLVVIALGLAGWAVKAALSVKARTVLEARELLIVDDTGKPRARIGTTERGTAVLALYGAQGYGGTLLEVNSNSRSHLRMGDNALGWLDLSTADAPAISLSGGSGNTGLTMWVTRDGLPSFRLGNPQGSPRLEFNLLDREAMEELLAPRGGSGGDDVAPSGDQYFMHREPRRPESQYTPHGWLFTGHQYAFDFLPAKPSSTSAVIAEPCQATSRTPRTTSDIGSLPGEVVPPVAISRQDPVFSAIAKRDRLQGLVILEIVVTEDGTVCDVRVLRGLGKLVDAGVVAAVRKWRFKPATVNGKPVAVYLSVTVNVRSS